MRVSAIMPTYSRRRTIPMALQCFSSQDWPDKELVVVDDGESVEDLFAGLENVVYRRLEQKTGLGAKKNIACEIASGEIIVHWDDDDWSAPGRITEQVNRITAEKPVTGFCKLLFWDMQRERASKYDGSPDYACDTSLCYTKEYWTGHRFKDCGEKEDHSFTYGAGRSGNMISVDGCQMMVALDHGKNTSQGVRDFPIVEKSSIPAAFFEDIKCISLE
jgi:glycosyltransferase involved in cell wall biosynthesis